MDNICLSTIECLCNTEHTSATERIIVLIDERINCLPTPRRLCAVLLTSTNSVCCLLLNQAGASNCISHSCLPFHIFKRNNHQDACLEIAIQLLLGSHMAIYLLRATARANAGAYRRPTGVTEQFVPRRSLRLPFLTTTKSCRIH